ncbi:MAG: bifunctional adenosylcobinamide kinase/adenosylcobinamide-phosphate guanylyltransferase [Lachnospiraceae bacterium]|nr:bifunctional adenosylcobinamide kinase/adenosylcobinamide-phosphate guanylyltransferase [Lachnospiraceae bacterium]
MVILVTGGSGSGKSAYAEEVLASLPGTGQNYYLAAMKVYGEEGRKKVERHRRLRAGKGFVTIEQPVDIGQAAGKMKAERPSAILECMSNLTANEMFDGEKRKGSQQTAEKILREVKTLSEHLKHLVIVTNNVFEDGIRYDDTTMDYMRALGLINRELARMADRVVEVIVGIPVVIKEGR